MPTTSITRSTRYTSQGVTKCYYLQTIAASTFIPTRAELTATNSRDLSFEIADLAGWTVTGNQIAAPDLSTRFEAQIAGKITAAQSSITFYADQTGIDVRAILPRDTTGFIVWMDGGDVPANKMSVFPITVISNSMERSAQGAAADRVMISFAITRVPAELITVPA